jgi:hypothetical protein
MFHRSISGGGGGGGGDDNSWRLNKKKFFGPARQTFFLFLKTFHALQIQTSDHHNEYLLFIFDLNILCSNVTNVPLIDCNSGTIQKKLSICS